ncbi:hypothetical protein ACQKWADRAFT_278518 [Trichoderma austrokoningii]
MRYLVFLAWQSRWTGLSSFLASVLGSTAHVPDTHGSCKAGNGYLSMSEVTLCAVHASLCYYRFYSRPDLPGWPLKLPGQVWDCGAPRHCRPSASGGDETTDQTCQVLLPTV